MCAWHLIRLFDKYAIMIEMPYWKKRIEEAWQTVPIVWLSL
jgi:hypothetical protein